MSSRVRKIQKLGTALKFPVEMYNTTVGSIVICGLMFNRKEINYNEIREKWKKYKTSKKELFYFEDPNLIDTVLNWFGLERPKYFPIAMVQSPYNILFCPYDKKLRRVLPLREDGFAGPTIRGGKVYPIVFNKVVRNRIWLMGKIKSIFCRRKKDVALQSKRDNSKGDDPR